MKKEIRWRWSAWVLGCAFAVPAYAGDPAPIPLVIQGHRFDPAEIHIKAGERRMLVVENRDASAEEFESHSLHREEIIRANASKHIYIGPLRPGQYRFFGEFHPKTAQGVVVAE